MEVAFNSENGTTSSSQQLKWKVVLVFSIILHPSEVPLLNSQQAGGPRLVPSTIRFLPVLATLPYSWGLRWTASGPWFNSHFSPSEKSSAKLFLPLCCIGMFPVLQGLAPFCKTSCILGVHSHICSVASMEGNICPCFSVSQEVEFIAFSVHLLTIAKLKWPTVALRLSLFSSFLKTITVFGLFQYFIELHLSSVVSNMDVASSFTGKSAQQVLFNLSKY